MVRMAARDVVITHPDKVLFPEDGITKAELAAYYEAIAPVMPHVRGRPVTLERYPRGIGERAFWQKDVEVERGEVGPKTFTLRTMPARIAAAGDLWSEMRKRRRSLRRAIDKLRGLQGSGAVVIE